VEHRQEGKKRMNRRYLDLSALLKEKERFISYKTTISSHANSKCFLGISLIPLDMYITTDRRSKKTIFGDLYIFPNKQLDNH